MLCEVEEQATRMPMSPSCLSNNGVAYCPASAIQHVDVFGRMMGAQYYCAVQ